MKQKTGEQQNKLQSSSSYVTKFSFKTYRYGIEIWKDGVIIELIRGILFFLKEIMSDITNILTNLKNRFTEKQSKRN